MDDLIAEHAQHMRRRNLADSTIVKRRGRLRRFDTHVGLRRATPERINDWLDSLTGRDGGPIEAKARYQWISDLHRFYCWAIDWGHLDVDPTVQVERPKQRKRYPRPIDSGDLVVALQMAEPTMYAWLTLGAFAGLRVGEMAALTPDSVQWEDRRLVVCGKGDKERIIPMHDRVESALRAVRLPSRGRLFRRPNGGPYPSYAVSRQVSEYFQGLGIDATAHMLRHYFGTQLYRACRDLRVVQEVMGHADPSTTAIYADWSRQEAERAVASLSLESEPSLLSDWPAAG